MASNSKNITKYSSIQSNQLKQIQQHVSSYFTNPQSSTACDCSICQQKYELKQKGKQFLRQSSSLLKIDSNRVKQFYKLMSSVNAKICFKLEIPTLCFFQKGECRFMFKSRNQGITMIEYAPTTKKNVANYFIEARQKADQILLDQKKANHIRHFNTVVPSFKHGVNQQKSKMSEAKSFIFHKNRKFQNQSGFHVQKNSSQQVAVVKYLDKGYQLLNQKQLRQLLKTPVSTVCIDFIQSYIKPHQKQTEFFFSEYKAFGAVSNSLMWHRSQIQIKLEINLINRFSKDFVPIQHLQSYEDLLKQIPDEYIQYQTYKMVHYLQLARDMKVSHLTTVWLKNQHRDICFFGVISFQYLQNQKVAVDLGQIYQLKQINSQKYSQLQQQLLKAWQNMKNRKLTVNSMQQSINIVQNMQLNELNKESILFQRKKTQIKQQK